MHKRKPPIAMRTQDNADRLRRVARKLETAAEELSAIEGAGIAIKLAHDLRDQAVEIEKCLPAERANNG